MGGYTNSRAPHQGVVACLVDHRVAIGNGKSVNIRPAAMTSRPGAGEKVAWGCEMGGGRAVDVNNWPGTAARPRRPRTAHKRVGRGPIAKCQCG